MQLPPILRSGYVATRCWNGRLRYAAHVELEAEFDELEAQLGDERRKVDVASHNFSVRELVRMMSDEELNIAPTYQRKFRWVPDNESLFVESVFLGLPVPPVFVATNVGFQWEVVDGLQRLCTLAHFLAPSKKALISINRKEPLRLTGLEKLSQLNGLIHSDLSKSLQVYFGRQPLQVISLTDKSDQLVRFDVFERLNRGAVQLTSQEVRACVYRGEFNAFLEELAEDATYLGLLKLQQARQHDGTKAEQVLKFFAYKNARDSFDGKVELFLNKYMGRAQHQFNYRHEQEAFMSAVQALSSFCEGRPFLRRNTAVTPLVQFEACLVAIAELQEEGVVVHAPPPGWQDDPELKDSSTGGTNTRSMLRRRIERAKEIFSGRT